MRTSLFSLLTFLVLTCGLTIAADKPHAVIVVGTHHYNPEKTMPPFAAELQRLGFKTTLINPDWDPEKDKRGLPGLEALAEADVAVFFTRFLKLDDEQLKHITSYIESGKPVVGFRTSTHGFNYPKANPNSKWNDGFGRDALGTPYQIHLAGKTEIKPIAAAKEASHPHRRRSLQTVDITRHTLPDQAATRHRSAPPRHRQPARRQGSGKDKSVRHPRLETSDDRHRCLDLEKQMGWPHLHHLARPRR